MSDSTHTCWIPKCLSCIGEYDQQQQDHDAGILRDNEPTPEPIWEECVNDAVTHAPTWLPAPNGAGIAAVVLPTCRRHLQTEKKSLVQRATESGLILGG